MAEEYDVVVVGSGPCGSSLALHLLREAPELARRTLVIDKAHHPRPKLCGGGLTLLSQYFIHKLGLNLEVPFERIDRMVFKFRGQQFTLERPGMLLVIRRDEFDSALVGEVQARGVEVRQGVELLSLSVPGRWGEPVSLQTSTGEILARVVVGADGAKSTVRRAAGLEGPSRVTRTIEVLTPEDERTCPEFAQHRAVFDFSRVPDGLQGYAWDFPCRVGGEARMNRGAGDFRVFPDQPAAPLKEIFREYLRGQRIDLDEHKLMGHPSRWYDPTATLSAPGVVLAGDAAGQEPLGGDGISAAFWYGQFVMEELARARERGDWDLSGYEGRLAAHPLGLYLTSRLKRARRFYSRRTPLAMRALWLLLAARSRLRPRQVGSLLDPKAG